MGKLKTRKPRKGLTFEDVWAALMETRKHQEETARQMKETDRIIKETNRKFGEFSNRFGEIVEYQVLPKIEEKFNDVGFTFSRTCNGISIKDEQDEYKVADIDIFLENGDCAIAIEVKVKTLQKDVDRHKQRMAVLRRSADKNNDKRVFYGAMAGAIMTDEVKAYAQKAGFYTIVPNGETVKIDVPESFIPRDW
ncbi:MAG: PD-(D/E)XK nuclease family protein [Treponema sp.]|nr:PD-(D/E)XK nuclease family protein [Treponema sp.]